MFNVKAERELLSKPGDTILGQLDHLKMTQAELAERMGKTPSKINDLISGKEPITVNTAIQLERVLGIDAQFWLNRETRYREKLTRIEQEEFLLNCKGWLDAQPIKDLKKFGYIKTEKKGTDMTDELLQFYSVVSPLEFEKVYIEDYATTDFKKSTAYRTSLSSMAAFLRIGEIEMKKLTLPEFDKTKFKDALEQIRTIAYEHPEDFAQQLKDICAKCGVAVIFSISFPGAPISGATRWIGGNPLIQLTDRYKTNDHFWIAFFHEAGHILLHGKKDVFIEEFNGAIQDKIKEEEAEKFAIDLLLSKKFISELGSEISEKDIKILEKKANIHRGIIVGILQRLDRLPHEFGVSLKIKVHLEYYILNSQV